MSSAPEAVLQFAPKNNTAAPPSDAVDAAGNGILGLIRRAAGAVEESNRHAVEVAQRLSAQLHDAEFRIRELEAALRHNQDRADRAEQWLYEISVEIEEKFLRRQDARHAEPAQPQQFMRGRTGRKA